MESKQNDFYQVISKITTNFELGELGADYQSYLEPLLEGIRKSFLVYPYSVFIKWGKDNRNYWEIKIPLLASKFPEINNNSIWNAIEEVDVFADNPLSISINKNKSKFIKPNAFIVINQYWD